MENSSTACFNDCLHYRQMQIEKTDLRDQAMISRSSTRGADYIPRLVWVVNHKTLLPAEVPILRSLGYSVFIPKRVPNVPDYRSAVVEHRYDPELSLPAFLNLIPENSRGNPRAVRPGCQRCRWPTSIAAWRPRGASGQPARSGAVPTRCVRQVAVPPGGDRAIVPEP